MLHEESASLRPPDGVLAGAIILACALLSMIVVSHHPTVHTHNSEQILRQVTEVGTMNEIVHGVLLAFMLALAYGFSIFSLRQGMHRQTTVAGLIAYLCGAAAISGAALIDGFFTTMMAGANTGASGPALASVLAVLAGGAAMIQVLTKFAFIALSFGILMWSIGMLRAAGIIRYVGIGGIIAAIIAVAVMSFGSHYITAALLLWILLPQTIWYVAVGTLLVQRRL